MEGQLLRMAARVTVAAGRVFTRRLITSLSVLILGLYVVQPAGAATDAFPSATAGFFPKVNYAGDPRAVVEALAATLKSLSIPVAFSDSTHIITDKLQGPNETSGATTKSKRFWFDIKLSEVAGQTRVVIGAMVEMASGPTGGQPGTWHNVTLFSLPTALGVRSWLYEAFENTLNGHARTQITQAPAAGAAAPTSVFNARLKQPAASGSDFDAGLGSSGDVGGGANAGASAKPARAH